MVFKKTMQKMIWSLRAIVLGPDFNTAGLPFEILILNIPVSFEVRIIEIVDGASLILAAHVDGVVGVLVAFPIDIISWCIGLVERFIHFLPEGVAFVRVWHYCTFS